MARSSWDHAGSDPAASDAEWLLTNGLGGFAMGTVAGVPTRRYHGLLVGATSPPVGRIMCLSGLVERLVLDEGTPREETIELSSFHFEGGVQSPDGRRHLVEFRRPAVWVWRIGDVKVIKRVELTWGRNEVTVSYRVRAPGRAARLWVRPLVAMRDFHAMLHADHDPESFQVTTTPRGVDVTRYGRALSIAGGIGARFQHDPQWWRRFEYARDRERGQDHIEDLLSPGVLTLRPERQGGAGEGAGEWSAQIVAALDPAIAPPRTGAALPGRAASDRAIDRLVAAYAASTTEKAEARAALKSLADAAAGFVVQRASPTPSSTPPPPGVSVIAGYPWFADWGRDTAISLPGLFLTLGDAERAGRVLATFARHRRRGLVPNVFNDQTGQAEYNTVDASLWFLHAACQWGAQVSATAGKGRAGATTDLHREIRAACLDIIDWYRRGTDFNIAMDPSDGLISAGNATTQLTWMDARRDGVVFTPRHGKAVEINALWRHGLVSVAELIAQDEPERAADLRALGDKAGDSFRRVFWNEERRCCVDVLTPAGQGDPCHSRQIRPNQIFSVSLRHSPLDAEQQRAVVACVREHLHTPRGLRTLAPSDPAYQGRFRGSLFERDRAYHNGTAWPWLLGPFAEAAMRSDGFSAGSRAEARAILRPLIELMNAQHPLPGLCLGQIPEVFDGDDTPAEPQRPGGCVAQAWSVAETLRVFAMSLGEMG